MLNHNDIRMIKVGIQGMKDYMEENGRLQQFHEYGPAGLLDEAIRCADLRIPEIKRHCERLQTNRKQAEEIVAGLIGYV